MFKKHKKNKKSIKDIYTYLKHKEEDKNTDKEKTGLKTVGTASTVLSADIVVKLIVIALVVVVLISILVSIICVILAAVQGLQGALNSLIGLNPDNLGVTGTTNKAVAGAQYVWNVQDLEKMPDEWSKNLYRLAWLADENKKAQDSDMPMNLLMGIPVLETGSKFFYSSEYETYSIAEQATLGGCKPTERASHITGIYACDASLVQENNIAEKATWGALPHADVLGTVTLDSQHKGYVNEYANGDIMSSVYAPSVSVAYTIHLYEQSRNVIFNKDADYGYAHQYKKYWETACTKYGVDPMDETARKDCYAMIYYMVHAGGVWEYTDIADDFYYAAWDYVLFLYTQVLGQNLNTYTFADEWKESDTLRTLSSTELRAAAVGNANTDYYGAVAWNESTITRAYLQYDTETADGEIQQVLVEKSLVEMWFSYNETNGYTDLNETYKTVYLHSNKHLVRQANYAVSTGYTTICAGNLRLDYIFDILDVNYVVNANTGYVCYAAVGNPGESGRVPDGFTAGTFDTENSKKSGYSNWRDESWFVTLNNDEWSNPLNPDLNGGFRISSRYGYRYLDSSNPWDWHSGMDLVYEDSTTNLDLLRSSYPVYAMHDGEITYINTSTGSNGGRYLHYKVSYVRDGVEVTRYLTYMHLSGFTDEIDAEISKQLKSYRGNVTIPVKRGEIIAYMGGSGNGGEMSSDGGYAVHLHISLSVNPAVNGPAGRLDMETELPFMTMYDNYTAWNNAETTALSGYLKQQPAADISASESDPQS